MEVLYEDINIGVCVTILYGNANCLGQNILQKKVHHNSSMSVEEIFSFGILLLFYIIHNILEWFRYDVVHYNKGRLFRIMMIE